MNVPPASTNRSRIANDVASSVRLPISIAPRLSTLTSRLVAGSVPIMRYFNSVSLLRAQHRVSAMKRSLSQTAGHNGLMPPYPSRPRWPLAAGLAAGVVLDALLGDPRRGPPVAAFGRRARPRAPRLRRQPPPRRRARGRLHPGRRRPRRAPAPPHADLAAGRDGRGRGHRVGGHRCPFPSP